VRLKVIGRNDKVGAGRMTITDSRPNELVQPFAATNTAEFARARAREGAGRHEGAGGSLGEELTLARMEGGSV
jgi:hypothetical protein